MSTRTDLLPQRALLSFCAALIVVAASPDAWLQFGHDPQHTHRSSAVGVNHTDILSSFPVDSICVVSPLVDADEVVYVGTYGGWYAVHGQSTLWSSSGFPLNDGATGASAVMVGGYLNGSSSSLYTTDSNFFQAYVLSPSSGAYESLVSPLGTSQAYTSRIHASPLYDPATGLVYFGASDNASLLYAWNPVEGALVWGPIPGFGWGGGYEGGPALSLDGKRVFTGSADGSVYALAANTGSLVWRNVVSLIPIMASPSVGLIDLRQGGAEYVFIGLNDENGLVALDSHTGELMWRTPAVGNVMSSAALDVDGSVCVVNVEGVLWKLSGATGDTIWSRQLPGTAALRGAPVIDGIGSLYVTHTSGLTSYSTNGSLIFDFPVAGGVNSSAAIGPRGSIHFVSYHALTVYSIFAVMPAPFPSPYSGDAVASVLTFIIIGGVVGLLLLCVITWSVCRYCCCCRRQAGGSASASARAGSPAGGKGRREGGFLGLSKKRPPQLQMHNQPLLAAADGGALGGGVGQDGGELA